MNFRTPLSRVLKSFQHNNASSFSHNESVPIQVEGTACVFGIVIVCGHSFHRAKSRVAQRSNCGFTTTGNHYIGFAQTKRLKRFTNRVGTRSTSTDNGKVWPHRPQLYPYDS